MLTFEEIKIALLSNPPSKVAIVGESGEIPIFGASTTPSDGHIWVAPYTGTQFKINENHSLKIIG